jgi:branched-chain amino acid transport system permease protein
MSFDYILTLVGLITVSIVLAMSLNLVMGYTGLMSVSHGASMGMGAYLTGVLSTKLGWDTSITIIVGAIGAGVIGWLFMVAAAQLDPDDFILASFALQMVVIDLLLRWTPVTGGSAGLFGIDRPSLFGFRFDDPLAFTIGLLVIAALSALVMIHIGRSGYAITLRGMRESPRSVEAAGRNVFSKQTVVWAVSSAFAGLAGGLYAVTLGLITPVDFDVQRSILIVGYLLVGGIGNMTGAILGATALMIIPEVIRNIDAIPTQWQGPGQQIVYGVVIVLFVWIRPQGIWSERPILRLGKALQQRFPRTERKVAVDVGVD